jgi:ABC-type nitrate/sulfonate/bicarbonate transport system substrate-binding protein
MSALSTIFSKKTVRTAVVLGISAATVVGMAACSSGSSSSTSSSSGSAAAADYGTLKLQLSWIKDNEFAGEFYADSKGYYKDAGFSAVTMTPGPTTGTAELLSGKADVALSDAVSVGSAVAKGQPLKVIATTYQKNPFTILSLKEKTPITTAKDMIGKKIGVDDSNTALFDAFLAANGIKKSQVTVVPGAFNGPTLLEGGQVDGYVSYLTNESIAVGQDGFTAVNVPFADNNLPFVAETITTTEDTIKNKPDELKAFLKAEIQGWTDAVNDPDGGADLAVNTYGKSLKLDATAEKLGAEAQADLVSTDETKTNGLFTISSSLQSETIASLAKAGVTVKASDLFDLSLLNDVYKADPDLKNYSK